MTSLAWKINRLRVMTVSEVVYRIYRWLWLNAEKALVNNGWRPRPKHTVRHKTSLFPNIEGWHDAWNKRFCLNSTKLDKLINGHIDLFSYEALSIGNPVNWQKDPLSGKNLPLVYGKKLDYRDDTLVGDVKVIWELGRHQHLVSLAVAYVSSKNTDYLDSIVEQIDGWINTNAYGMGIHWCSSLEVGLRQISWVMVHSLLQLKGHQQGLFEVLDNPDRFGESIFQHAWFIRNYLSKYSSANNHLIGELTALWVSCQVFDFGPKGRKWAAYAQKELERQAQDQIFNDGVDKEQAVYYHLWVQEYLLFSWLVGERSKCPFSNLFEERILLMARFLTDISVGIDKPPQLGDADDGFVIRFEPVWPINPYHDVQNSVSYLFKNKSAVSEGRLTQKAFWYGLIAGILPSNEDITNSPIKKNYPLVYENGGYAILGDEQLRIVFDAGPLGYPAIAAHGHADALSLCMAIENEWWLVDPGTYAYHSESNWRDFFRGTSAHNTITINNRNQSKIGGAFMWLEKAHAEIEEYGKKNNGEQYVKGWHGGYKTFGIVHHREIRYCEAKKNIVITDILENRKRKGLLQASIYFHFAPDLHVTVKNSTCIARKPENGYMLLIELDNNYEWTIQMGQIDPIQGWYSPVIGEKIPAPVLVGNCRFELSTKVETRFHVMSSDVH